MLTVTCECSCQRGSGKMSLGSSLLGQEVRGYLVFEGFKMSVIVNASKLVIRDKYKTYW